jgi:nitroreductase
MNTTNQRGLPVPAQQVDYLLATAARAPSVHNTQPWEFKVGTSKIELFADPRRKLRLDPLGREMLLSCGAALLGLRLAIRSLGYVPEVKLLPDPSQLRLLARVSLRAGPPMDDVERAMLDAVPHRHTHRGPFADGSLPPGLIVALQQEALAEGAALSLVRRPGEYSRLAAIVSRAGAAGDLDPVARSEIMHWSRPLGSNARDGVPARAFSSGHPHEPGRLRQRDFDLGRGIGTPMDGGSEPLATAVLLTFGDRRLNWLQCGQALQKVLLHAASKWVYASIYTQPLESADVRSLVARSLSLPGSPQVLLQFGRADSTEPTSRRPAHVLVRR